jgi:hypothetical protein
MTGTAGRSEAGKATAVVQDVSVYPSVLDRAEAIAGIRRGLDSANRGEGEAAADVFARLRKKHKIAGE